MLLNFYRPAFQGGFAFPQQFFVAMDMAAVHVVFCRVIAQQTEIKKISSAWQKFEWREVSLVKRRRIGPDPADTMLFQEPDKLRPA